MTRSFAIWIAGLILTSAAAWFCYLWLDRPIALWVHGATGTQRLPDALVNSPFSSTAFIAAAAFVVCGLVALARTRFSRPETTIALCVISMVNAILVKDQLKFVFGRTWPDMFLRDGTYGFHFFRGGQSFESFPSGHAAVASAFLFIPWLLFPRLRALTMLCVIAVGIGLVMLNLHFLGDVIAGSFLGFSAALFTVCLWRAARLPLTLQAADPLARIKNAAAAAPAAPAE